jgi:hypothetical protein
VAVSAVSFGYTDQRLLARSKTDFIQADSPNPFRVAAASYRSLSSGLTRIWMKSLAGFSAGGLPGFLGVSMRFIMSANKCVDKNSLRVFNVITLTNH